MADPGPLASVVPPFRLPSVFVRRLEAHQVHRQRRPSSIGVAGPCARFKSLLPRMAFGYRDRLTNDLRLGD